LSCFVAVILRESDVQDLIEMDDVIAAVEDAMQQLGEGDAHNEPRRRAFAPSGLLNVMFASYPNGNCTGLKAYTVSDGHVRFMVAMFKLDGALDALVEADFMGAYRTGAATAIAAKALGARRPSKVALIGTGWQGATQALALSRVVEIDEMRVFSRNADRRAAFAEEQAEQLGIQVVDAPSAEAAVRGADIIVTVTTSHAPVIDAAWVEPHAFIAAVGSNFRNRTELPADLIERAQTVVVDQLGVAQLESGDLIQAAEAGKFDWSQAIELSSVVAGRWERPDRPGIAIFESHGLALWDLAAASVVVAAARRRGGYEEIEFLV
jgi:alanine dehydrogenase